MITPPDQIETLRLVMRRPVGADAELIFNAYGQDPRVTKYLCWTPHKIIANAQAGIVRRLQGWEQGTEYTWMMILRSSGRLIGSIGVRPDTNGMNLGYVLAHDFWGQGLMTEAVRAVVEWALSQPNVFRVWAVCQVDNIASARVLEKAGLTREGILRRWAIHPNVSDEPQDCFCYAKVR